MSYTAKLIRATHNESKSMNIYFLGGGNMASAIIAGLYRSGTNDKIIVAERNADRRNFLSEEYGAQCVERLPELSELDVLVLAVKPQDMQNACAQIQSNGALVLSIAAGLEIETLTQYLNGNRRIIRIMPNTPAQIGLGVAGLFAAAETNAHDRQTAERIMAASSQVIWLEKENQMHSITAISGSGPAYVFYLLNALQQAAQAQGFSQQEARTLSLATFQGAVALAAESGQAFQALQDQVTSKGGTTFAALETFRTHQIAENLEKGVQAAANRSREMAQS